MRIAHTKVLLLTAVLVGGAWRVVPAQADDVTWTGAASTSWNNTNNWQPTRLPTAADHAIIPAGTPACTNTTSSTVDQLTVGGELTLRNGTFNLATTGHVEGVLHLSGAVLGGSGTLTVGGSLNWNVNDVTGLRRIVLLEGSTSVISGSAAPNKHLICPIENRGRLVQRNTGPGAYYMYAGGVLDNRGTYEIEDDSYILWNVTRGVITNRGVFQKTGGGGRSEIQVPFHNEEGGVLGSTTTTGLQFTASFSAAGTGSIGTGIVNVTGGNGTLAGRLGGPGCLRLAGGSLSIAGASEVGNFALAGGALAGTDAMTVTQSFVWTSGIMTGACRTVLSQGTTNVISGTVTPNKHLRATLENHGLLRHFGTGSGAFYVYPGGVVDNHGVYQIEDDSSIAIDVGSGVVSNRGAFLKTGGGSPSDVRVPFRNVEGGTVGSTAATGIHFTASFSASGAGAVSTGTVSMTGGSATMAGNLAGPGVFRLAGGSLLVAGDSTIDHLLLDGGTLTGPARLTVSQSFAWAVGMISNGMRLVLSEGSTNSIGTTKATNKHLYGTLENHGRLVQSGSGPDSFIMNGGSSLDNRGTYAIADDSHITVYSGSGVITNHGMFEKTGGVLSVIRPSFVNATGGVLAARSGNTTLLLFGNQEGVVHAATGATLQVSNGLTNNGAVRGAGSINVGVGTVLNRGTVAPGDSVGRLTITGHYVQAASGVLDLELGGTTPGSGHDQLRITGGATLDGTVRVTLDGGYVPADGDVFAFMTHASRGGAFAVSDLPALPPASCWGFTQTAGQSFLFREPAFTAGGAATAWYRLRNLGPAAGQTWNQAQWDAVDGQDPDTDGDANAREYFADTHPTNGASFFPRAALAGQPGITTEMPIAQTSTGRLYGVETATDLRAGDWNLVPPEVPGTAGTLTFILTNDVPFRAYRTRVRVP